MAENITTFKPLKGHRFKCNQTGVVVSAGKTEAYRRQRFNLSHPKPKQKEPSRYQPALIQRPQSILREARIDSSGCVYCPHCSQWHHPVYVNVGEMRCRSCGQKFIAVSPPAQNLPRVRIDTNDNSAMCPYCSRWNFKISPGEKSCEDCGTRFIAYR